jgi:hypothetical protein
MIRPTKQITKLLTWSLFGRPFNTVTCDEAHEGRKPTRLFYAILHLAKSMLLLMTATPLYTGPQVSPTHLRSHAR